MDVAFSPAFAHFPTNFKPASFVCVISPPICFLRFLSFFFIFVSSSLPLCFLHFLSINVFRFVCGFPSYELIDEEASTRQVLFFLFYFLHASSLFFSKPDISGVVKCFTEQYDTFGGFFDISA